MTNPRRFAALAVCLLALAAGAAAADCASAAGTFNMELVDVGGTNANAASHEVATCLTSVKVTIVGTGCAVSLDSTSAGSVLIPALWFSQANYKQLQECPATSADGAKGAGDADTVAGAAKGLLEAINKFAYGGQKDFSLASIAIADGIVTVQDADGTTPALKFVYAIKQTTVATIAAMTSGDVASLKTAGSIPAAATKDVIGDSCAAGRYGIVVTDETTGDELKLCPLCPAGTYGDGDGCTACAAGTYSGIVGTDAACTSNCPAGEYAPEGSSACQPCPTGTFQDGTGQGECKECPNDSYAWIPGSSQCLRCVKGVPVCVAGGSCTTDGVDAGSPGYHVLKFGTDVDPTAGGKCGLLSSSYAIKPYDQCDSWKAAPASGTAAAVQLSLFVNGDCSVTISPISDKTCADPGATTTVLALNPWTANTNGVDGSGNYKYNYNDLLLRAYYTTPTSIRSLLPSTAGGATSSMLGIDQIDATSATLKFWAATNKAADATTVEAADDGCSVTALTAGGKVFTGTTLKEEANCPAGSYGVTGELCLPCPQGYTCTGGKSKVSCAADTANPYLGATTSYCTDCKAASGDSPRTRPTSYAGAGYCTVPYLERNCATAGTYWDESAAKCLDCPAGTARAANDATNLECTPCDPGYYSGPKAAACSICPAGQYSPSYGLADQEATLGAGIHCLRCPTGSIALKDAEKFPDDVNSLPAALTGDDYRDEKTLSEGATKCVACPDGTYATAKTYQTSATAVGCTPCPAGKYRAGDASPQNNVCNPVPNGYKVKGTIVGSTAVGTNNWVCTDTATDKCVGAYSVEACTAGTVSSWNGDRTVRAPLTPLTCQPCADNTYAPKTGMTACITCKGGFYPTKTGDANAVSGFDQCITACAAGKYRSFYKKQATCDTCDAAGYESGPSARTGCTQCRPGYFKGDFSAAWTDSQKDNCQPCPQNRFMARPGAKVCDVCPKGYETQDTGNTACDPCAVGYYKTAAGATSCVKAPVGTFVNTSAAYFATPCPLGTFNDQLGQDLCDPCAPGQYANALGSRACKTCPAGTFSNGQAATCRACEAGYYSVAGSGACSPCKPGTYSGAARSGTCALCPKGYQCPTPATKTPRACPAGTYAAKDGSALCTPCPVNFISAAAGSKQCTACAAGTNTRGLTGQKACTAVRVTTLRRSVL